MIFNWTKGMNETSLDYSYFIDRTANYFENLHIYRQHLKYVQFNLFTSYFQKIIRMII